MNTSGDAYLLPSREEDNRRSQAHQASLGIDVAKAKFDAALLRQGKLVQRTFPMNPAGFVAVDRWIGELGVAQVHVCLEATGEYGAALALAHYESGRLVSTVPARIAAYAKSRLARSKTDKTDAALIAHFCAREQPPLWTPPSAEVTRIAGAGCDHGDAPVAAHH